MQYPHPTGYPHHDYAASLAEFGMPRQLPYSEGWILERPVPGGLGRDAMGPYPLFFCRDWTRLRNDLDEIGPQLVSLALVADPFGDYREGDLQACFPDHLARFKDHFVVELDRASPGILSKHHRYYARRALNQVEVEEVGDTGAFLPDWVALYATLVERHGLRGIKAFSPQAFAQQMRIPGLVVLRAHEQGRTIGAHLWYVTGEVAYSHLLAVNDRGYELMAAYALYWTALECFRGRVRWLDIGAGAGADGGDSTNGLTRFKRGWATDTRPVYFCGRILDPIRYAAAATAQGIVETNYFPAYRAGEFG